MLQLLLLFVETSALKCNPEYLDKIVPITLTLPIDPGNWVPPSTEGMECTRGYSNCWAPGSHHTGCTYEYSISDLEVCTRHSVSVVAPEENNATLVSGVVIDDESTVQDHDKNFNEELWSDILSPTKKGCALQNKAVVCDTRTSNCRNISEKINSLFSRLNRERRSCDEYFINSIILDENLSLSDRHNIPFTLAKTDGYSTEQDQISSSVTVAWTTTLPNNQCMAAYNLCWRNQNSAKVDCQVATDKYTWVETTSLLDNTKYQISYVTLANNNGTKSDPSSKEPQFPERTARNDSWNTYNMTAGCNRFSCSILIHISAMFCLWRLST